jgi:hypothetical protein
VSSDAPISSVFEVEVMVIGGDAERLHAVLSPYLLYIARNAIVEAQEMTSPPHLDLAKARIVRLKLQAGHAVLGIFDGRSVEKGLWLERGSFAKRSRPRPAQGIEESSEMRERTRAFLRARGITPVEKP